MSLHQSQNKFFQFGCLYLLKTNPDFYYGGPHALKAALAASRPVMLGGRPELAKEHFEGGGHKNAAGGKSAVSVAETKDKLISILAHQKNKFN